MAHHRRDRGNAREHGAVFHRRSRDDGGTSDQPDRVGVYVDGARVGEILSSQAGGWPIRRRIYFGGPSRLGTGVGNWNYVAFETGVHIIPEPAALSLLGLGALAALRRQKPVGRANPPAGRARRSRPRQATGTKQERAVR